MKMGDNIEIKKDALPVSILKKSMLIILFNVLILLLFVFWIPFKNVLEVKSELKGKIGSTTIIAPKSGVVKLDNISNEMAIKKNQIIGYYEQNKDWAPILATNDAIFNLQYDALLNNPQGSFEQLNTLDISIEEVIPELNNLKLALQQYAVLATNDRLLLEKKKKILLEKSNFENQKEKLFVRQDSLNKEDLSTLIASMQKRDSLLYFENILSKENIELKTVETVRKRMEIINKDLEHLTFLKNKSDIFADYLIFENNFYSELKRSQNIVKSTLHNLKNKLKSWNQKNTIIAPESGTLIYDDSQKRQVVQENDTIALISPQNLDTTNFLIYLNIPKKYIHYLQIGQKVRTELQEYPTIEFGVLEGELVEIFRESSQDYYLCKAKLTKGLQTSYGNRIEPKGIGYNCISKISVENESLWSKLKKVILWKYSDFRN